MTRLVAISISHNELCGGTASWVTRLRSSASTTRSDQRCEADEPRMARQSPLPSLADACMGRATFSPLRCSSRTREAPAASPLHRSLGELRDAGEGRRVLALLDARPRFRLLGYARTLARHTGWSRRTMASRCGFDMTRSERRCSHRRRREEERAAHESP